MARQVYKEIHHTVKCRDMDGQKYEHIPLEPCLNVMNSPVRLNRKCRTKMEKWCKAMLNMQCQVGTTGECHPKYASSCWTSSATPATRGTGT